MQLEVFAKRLRALRQSRGMSLQNVGDVVGANRQHIGNLENSRVSPSLSMTVALADLFNVSVDYLVGRSDDPARIPVVGENPTEIMPEQDLEQQKIIRMVNSLHEQNADKALSYITFLRVIQRREDRKNKPKLPKF